LGADRVELYTEPYAEHFGTAHGEAVLQGFAHAAAAARSAGLGVNAGHDLNLDNLPALVAALPNLAEASIGHELTADALKMGWSTAVAAYKAALAGG
jgi:pyridoxine 5-phosphate synthase